jgi:hypothetical protein
MASTVGTYVVEALAILERQAPGEYATIARLLHQWPARCEFVGESFEIHGVDGRAEIRHERSGRCCVTVVTSPETIVRLLDGTEMLERLLATEKVRIAGDGDALIALSRISEAAVAGGLRSLDMHELFERFRGWVG